MEENQLELGIYAVGDDYWTLYDMQRSYMVNGEQVFMYHLSYDDEHGLTWTTKVEDTIDGIKDLLNDYRG